MILAANKKIPSMEDGIWVTKLYFFKRFKTKSLVVHQLCLKQII